MMESVVQAFLHFYFLDKANACIHESNARFSPITFGLHAAVASRVEESPEMTADLACALTEVGEHDGAYQLDKGR